MSVKLCDLLSIKDIFKINMLNRRSVPFNAGENDGQTATQISRVESRQSRVSDVELRGQSRSCSAY